MNRTPVSLAASLAASLVAALGLAALPVAPALAASLTVVVEGVSRPTGNIRLELSSSEAAYQGRAAPARAISIPARAPATRIEIPDLTPGLYAFRVHHDADGDGRLDTGAMGQPTEGWSASNGAAGPFGPGPWSKAAFQVNSGSQSVTVRLR